MKMMTNESSGSNSSSTIGENVAAPAPADDGSIKISAAGTNSGSVTIAIGSILNVGGKEIQYPSDEFTQLINSGELMILYNQ